MEKFVKYLSKSHLNRTNVALYTTEQGAIAKAEIVANGTVLGQRKFDSVEAATEWYDALPGNRDGQLANAIESLTDGRHFSQQD